MITRSILTRGAFIGLALAGLVALADGMARAQLTDAVRASRGGETRTVVHIAGATD